jgi:hypothetical protein
MDLYQVVQHASMKSGRMNYRVQAQEKVCGRPSDEVLKVNFWVSIDGKGEMLTAQELAAFVHLVVDQAEQLKGAKYLKDIRIRTNVNFELEPAVVEHILTHLDVEEPAE